MAKRCALLFAVALALVAAPALADPGYGKQKAALDAKLAAAKAKLTQARTRESQLNGQIVGLGAQITRLETRVADVGARMSALQRDLALRRRRLDTLNRLYRTQTARVHALQGIYRIAIARLDLQLVRMYKTPEPALLDLVVEAHSFQDVLDQMDYLKLIAKQEEAVGRQVAAAKQRVAVARVKTVQVRRRVANEANLINARLEQVAIIHNELLTSSQTLRRARAGKSVALLVARTQEKAAIQESNATAAASAQIEARIRAAERTRASPTASTATSAAVTSSAVAPPAPPAASGAGLIWPVNGPITSPFGPRWGGFHPGIDIGAATGTPIAAAAAGTVIWCGWQSGYGNLVVIDHHNGIATAYAHQSRIAVACNQEVGQGQVIGYVGCTGFCTGPHLHFEVRLNGSPVDPLGYLS
jgi:murein DD-endopeptidase MepM/ murein hydrolase activator NlpD